MIMKGSIPVFIISKDVLFRHLKTRRQRYKRSNLMVKEELATEGKYQKEAGL